MSSEARAHGGRTPHERSRRCAPNRVVLLGFVCLFAQPLYIPALLDAATVVNVARVSARSGPSSPPVLVDSNPAVTVIAAVPPVLGKEVSPAGTVGPGDTLVYTLSFRNPGPSALTNVVITDPLHPLIESVSAVTTGSVPDTGPGGGSIAVAGAFDPAAREVRWTIPSLGPGSEGRVSFSARLVGSLTGETSVSNAFTVTSDQDPNAAVSPTVSNPVVAPALTLFLQSNRDRVSVGDLAAFQILVANSDPVLDLASTQVRLSLPRGFRFQEGSLSADGRALPAPVVSGKGRRLEIAAGDLASGEGLVIRVVGVAAAGAREGVVQARAESSALTLSGAPVSARPARVSLRVVGSLLDTDGVIAGRVFADADGDGAWSPSDPLVPGARLYLEDGTQVLTDALGRFHVERMRPGLHVLKLDPETVPEDLRGAATWNRGSGSAGVQFIDLAAGELFKANVGLDGPGDLMAAVEIRTGPGKEVRILAASLFEAGSGEIRPEAEAHLEVYAELLREVPPGERFAPPGQESGGADPLLARRIASLDRAVEELLHPPARRGVRAGDAAVARAGGGSVPPSRGPAPVATAAARSGAGVEPALEEGSESATEAALKALPRGLHVLAPRDGAIVTAERIDVDVAFPTGYDIRLAVNGRSIPDDRVGVRMTTSLSGMSLHRYVGVELDPGSNHLEARASAPGRMAQVMELTVDRVSGPALLVIRGEGGAQKADGKTPGRAAVQALDGRGHPVADGTMITLEVDRGSLLGRDADRVAEGFQAATESGYARVSLSPATASESRVLRATAGEVISEGEIRFEPEMRRWILAGVGEAGWSSSGKALTGASAGGDLTGSADTSARMALFARGRITDKDLLSLSWDTGRARDEDELFRVEDPLRPFPVYGDASAQAHTLESQGKLAVRWERERSMAAYGDFRTGMTAAELARYDRPLNGVLAHVETGRVTVHAFGASTPQTTERDVMAADGSSGPYRLSRRGIVAYSERVILEVRDRFKTERVLSTSPQQRFTDYDIDYEAGTILFRSPVASQDAGFNPVLVVVTFEVADASGDNVVTGGRFAYRPGARFEMGASAVREARSGEDFLLTGADFTVRPWLGAALTAEYAGTSDATGRTGAYAIRFQAAAGSRVGVAAYVRSIPADFSNPSMSGVSEIGTTKSGLELRASMPDGSTLLAETFRQEQERVGLDRSSAALSWRKPAGPLTWEVGGRGLEGTGETSGEQGRSGLVRAGIKARLGKRVDGSLYRQEVVAGETVSGFPTRTSLGAGYRINEHVRGFLQHEQDQSELQNTGRTLLGVEGVINDVTTVESRYAMEDALNGQRGYAILGVRARLPLTELWTADLRAERAQTVTGVQGADFTSLTAGAEYLPGRTKLTGRYEVRFGEQEDRHLLSSSGAVRMGSDMVLFARSHLSLSQPDLAESRMDVDGLLGLAYRPMNADRINWLGRIEASRGERLPGGGTSLATAPSARGYTGLFEANFQPVRRWHLLGRYAGRYSSDAFSSRSERVYTEVWEARSLLDLGRRVTAGVAGRVLRQPSSGTSLTGIGVESGVMVARDLWLVAGYNITGFSDRYFPDGDRREQGPFVSLRFKFDESLFGDLFTGKDEPGRMARETPGGPETQGAPAPSR